MADPNDADKIATALGLFASCIKSGEDWSPTCETAKQEAFDALARLISTPALPADGWPTEALDLARDVLKNVIKVYGPSPLCELTIQKIDAAALAPPPMRQLASDIACDLGRMIDAFLEESDLHKKQNLGIQIRQHLWANKVGVLRVLQAVAGTTAVSPRMRDSGDGNG